jgi:mannose-6-phosphate isomerase-like protein (cupin superfamily)
VKTIVYLETHRDRAREEKTLSTSYTHKHIDEVTDSAPQFGFGEQQEARFATKHFDTRETGFSFYRIKPGRRQGFGHHHDHAEEVYFIASGSGRMKLDGEIVEVNGYDAIRVAPKVTRAFEAGPEGLEVLAFGSHHEDDRGEILPGWWSD